MQGRKILKTILLPAATVVLAVDNDQNQNEAQKELKCRPSELPIYTKENPNPPPKETEEPQEPSVIEETVYMVRSKLTTVYTEAQAYKKVGVQYLEEGRENADWLINYLRQEDNTLPKAGAIAIGGLTGLILGLRGGRIKKTIYATTGALTMAAVCYPKEAAEYSKTGLSEAKKYATIAYNFAYGVKKDDPPLELPQLPKMPSSLSEAWNTLSKSATNLVSGEEKEKEASKPDKK